MTLLSNTSMQIDGIGGIEEIIIVIIIIELKFESKKLPGLGRLEGQDAYGYEGLSASI